MKSLLMLLLLATGTARAQTGTVGPATLPGATREAKLFAIKDALKAMDTNGDARITKSEWMAAKGKAAGFETLDTNRDDVLTAQELRSNARKLRAFEDFQAAPAF